jgi:hypothetical protein
MIKLSIWFVLVSLPFPASTLELGLTTSGWTLRESDLSQSIADLSFLAPSTTSGWPELDSATNGASHPSEDECASSSAVGFSRTAFDPGNASPPEIPDRDQPGNVTGVMAVALCWGALRLYLKSPGFQKFLWETFSPLSPLGYWSPHAAAAAPWGKPQGVTGASYIDLQR